MCCRRQLHRGLAGLARGTGASLFMVLQAALAGLLSRLGAGPDIAIGSPIAGRTDGALDDLIGFFVNTLVLRTDTSGNPDFTALIGRVRSANLAAYAQQELPFERLVEVLNPARSLSRHPLFQVMLAFESGPVAGAGGGLLQLPGLELTPQAMSVASAKFDLSVGLSERRASDGTPAGIDGVLEYASDLFDRATVAALGERLVRLLEGVVAAPDRALGGLDILGAAERDTILRVWNDTGHDLTGHVTGHALVHGLADGLADVADGSAPLSGGVASDRVAAATLPSLFAAQALRTPDAIAVIFEDRTLTYAALDAHANRLAHHLQSLGVGPETMVGLCVERSPEMVVGLLGILKAGGAYLPLDPNYPRERLAFMLADAGAPVLVTQQALLDRLPVPRPGDAASDATVTVVRLDADWPAIARKPATAPQLTLDPRHPAYVIYTSGSTGTPKGVVVEHASLANKLLTLGSRISRRGRSFRIALPEFDARSIRQSSRQRCRWFTARQLSLSAMRRESCRDQFWEHMVQQKVNLLNCTPSLFDHDPSDDVPQTASWTLIVAGDACRKLNEKIVTLSEDCEIDQCLRSDRNYDLTPSAQVVLATK